MTDLNDELAGWDGVLEIDPMGSSLDEQASLSSGVSLGVFGQEESEKHRPIDKKDSTPKGKKERRAYSAKPRSQRQVPRKSRMKRRVDRADLKSPAQIRHTVGRHLITSSFSSSPHFNQFHPGHNRAVGGAHSKILSQWQESHLKHRKNGLGIMRPLTRSLTYKQMEVQEKLRLLRESSLHDSYYNPSGPQMSKSEMSGSIVDASRNGEELTTNTQSISYDEWVNLVWEVGYHQPEINGPWTMS